MLVGVGWMAEWMSEWVGDLMVPGTLRRSGEIGEETSALLFGTATGSNQLIFWSKDEVSVVMKRNIMDSKQYFDDFYCFTYFLFYVGSIFLLYLLFGKLLTPFTGIPRWNMSFENDLKPPINLNFPWLNGLVKDVDIFTNKHKFYLFRTKITKCRFKFTETTVGFIFYLLHWTVIIIWMFYIFSPVDSLKVYI